MVERNRLNSVWRAINSNNAATGASGPQRWEQLLATKGAINSKQAYIRAASKVSRPLAVAAKKTFKHPLATFAKQPNYFLTIPRDALSPLILINFIYPHRTQILTRFHYCTLGTWLVYRFRLSTITSLRGLFQQHHLNIAKVNNGSEEELDSGCAHQSDGQFSNNCPCNFCSERSF